MADFLKGRALATRLEELASIANENALGAERSKAAFLDYAYKCGEALVEAKRRLGGRGKWQYWIRHEFHKSYETGCAYMRLFRKWNDPRMVAARQSGRPLATLDSALRIIRGESLAIWQKKNNSDPPNAMRSDIRGWVSDSLRELGENELFVLHRDFHDPLWPQLERRVQNRVNAAIDDACDEGEGIADWGWIERAKVRLNAADG